MNKYLLILLSISILFTGACKKEKPKSRKGVLELNSRPQGADVILNSKLKLNKQTPLTVRPAPATYLVKMDQRKLPAGMAVCENQSEQKNKFDS